VNVTPKTKILTESEKTLHQLESEINSLSVNSSSPQEILEFCFPALKQLQFILSVEKEDALIIEQTESLIKIVEDILKSAAEV
jgi:hypothetical protein